MDVSIENAGIAREMEAPYEGDLQNADEIVPGAPRPSCHRAAHRACADARCRRRPPHLSFTHRSGLLSTIALHRFVESGVRYGRSVLALEGPS
jgi:hypothetical protein